MAQRVKQPTSMVVQFPPEAAESFGVVHETEIVGWQKKLAERFGYGTGKLIATEEPEVVS